jgi:hypothetical protein
MPEKLDSVLATKRDLRFWLVFVALAIATGLNAIDLVRQRHVLRLPDCG